MAGETYGADPSCSNPYGRNSNGPTLHGIDTSEAQGANFSFDKAAADNVRFCFHKATQGTGYVDKTFARNWRASKDAGLLRGAYHFLNPSANIDMQVDNYLRALDYVGGLQNDDLHSMLDAEVSHGVGPADLAFLIMDWIEKAEEKTGREVLIYTGPNFWRTSVVPGLSSVDAAEIAKRKLFIAHYVVDPSNGNVYNLQRPIVPAPFTDFKIWQVTGNRGARIPGTAGPEDRDTYWGDEIQFRNDFTKQKFEVIDGAATPIRAGGGVQVVPLDGGEYGVSDDGRPTDPGGGDNST